VREGKEKEKGEEEGECGSPTQYHSFGLNVALDTEQYSRVIDGFARRSLEPPSTDRAARSTEKKSVDDRGEGRLMWLYRPALYTRSICAPTQSSNSAARLID